jgi:flagellin
MFAVNSTPTAPGAAVLSRIIGTYNKSLSSSLEKIASGLKVSSPSDDTWAYFRGKDLNSLASVSGTAASGLTDHVSRLQTAEDALKSIQEILDQMAELAQKASTESNDTIRGYMGAEYDQMKASITTIVNTTRYDGALLLNGAFDLSAAVNGKAGTSINAQVGEQATDTYAYQILDTRVDQDKTDSGNTFKGLNLNDASAATSWKTGTAAAQASFNELTASDAGNSRIARNLTRIATGLLVINGAKTTLENKQANYLAASSSLTGVDQAEESSRYTSLQIQQQAAASFLAQSNINYGNVIGMLTGFSRK